MYAIREPDSLTIVAGLPGVQAAIYAHCHDPKHYDLACPLANESAEVMRKIAADKKFTLIFPGELMQFIDRNDSRIVHRRKPEEAQLQPEQTAGEKMAGT